MVTALPVSLADSAAALRLSSTRPSAEDTERAPVLATELLAPQRGDDRRHPDAGRDDRLDQEQRQLPQGDDVAEEPDAVQREPGEVRHLGDDPDHPAHTGGRGGPAGTDRLQDGRHPVRQAGHDRGDPAQNQHAGPLGSGRGSVCEAEAHSASGLVLFGSTGMPGPIVVEMVAFFRYRPLDALGLSRSTSSSAAK